MTLINDSHTRTFAPHQPLPLKNLILVVTAVALASSFVSQVFSATGSKVEYKVGTMIEVPRGALRAGDLAKTAEFFSFGTNDLTQMTFGISRDDAQVIVILCYLLWLKDSWKHCAFVIS